MSAAMVDFSQEYFNGEEYDCFRSGNEDCNLQSVRVNL